jgi:integrase/recombinase XerD
MTALAPVLESFFTDRLMTQRGASPHTIASYRDTFTLLLGHVHQQTGKLPAQLDLADLDAPVIGAFLQHLEATRGNTAATRNARLAAIRSLFRYASLRAPEHAALISRVLQIQPKRTITTIVSYLTPGELDALLAAPDRTTWHGRRDHALLVLAAQTGLRVSELTGLATGDVHLGTGPHAYCHGKGRKDRATPLTPHTVAVLGPWITEQHADPARPLFATRTGTPLSRDAVEHLVTRHATTAARTSPTLASKKITPHTLRHTAAMNLLHAGVDITVIALWLGHEDPATTRVYLFSQKLHQTGERAANLRQLAA